MGLDLPETLATGQPGSGQFEGISPVLCKECGQRLALLRLEEPLLDSQYRALVSLARQLNLPACIDIQSHLRQVWPESRPWPEPAGFWRSLAHDHGRQDQAPIDGPPPDELPDKA